MTHIAALYQLRLKPNRADEYHLLWKKMVSFMKSRGALGSTIHQADNGDIIIYSRWPDKKTYHSAWPEEDRMEAELPKEIFLLSEEMKACIEELIDQKTLQVKEDCLLS